MQHAISHDTAGEASRRREPAFGKAHSRSRVVRSGPRHAHPPRGERGKGTASPAGQEEQPQEKVAKPPLNFDGNFVGIC